MISTTDTVRTMGHVLKTLVSQKELERQFRTEHPVVNDTQFVDGFTGNSVLLAAEGGRTISRGRGYAVLFMDPILITEDIHAAPERIYDAARKLGRMLGEHLEGHAPQRIFADAEGDARKHGIGFALSGIDPIAADSVAWPFFHLSGCPHLRNDDGLFAMRDAKEDRLQVVLRFWGNLVPQSAIDYLRDENNALRRRLARAI